jgi:hypothetical protein
VSQRIPSDVESAVSGKQVKFSELMGFLRANLARIPEHRRGGNGHYEIAAGGLAAFSVFFMQEPSFLAYQTNMQAKHGHNNAKSLFGVAGIPSDGQTRNLLDPVDPATLAVPFWATYDTLAGCEALTEYLGATGTRLVSLDGTQYFASQKVHCANCRVTLRDGRTYYSHQVLLGVVGAPEQPHVICLPPEFITPQDGVEKQDCEQQAIKRWVKQHAEHFSPWSATVLTDDLHAHQPVCQLLLDHQLHFILTCKPESHPALYEELQLLERVAGAIGGKTARRWNGRYHEVSFSIAGPAHCRSGRDRRRSRSTGVNCG